MIEVENLTKRYGPKTAVDGLSFTVRPGVVTGFLGPNGAGKSTTLRLLVGLDAPTSGGTKVNGKPYRRHRAPLREIGVLLEARAVHPGRSARDHLLAVGATHGIGAKRVDEVLDVVGLTEVARRRVGKFSLGMGQRLGIGVALLGDPRAVVLDEPVNGLDPDGIKWIRHLLRDLAAEGRTVFVSSHLMSEMALTADHLVVVGRGKLVADVPVADLIASTRRGVRVRTPRTSDLVAVLQGDGVEITSLGGGVVDVIGLSTEDIGTRALVAGIPLFELTPQRASLEEAYTELTRDAVEYRGTSERVAA
ncbi:ATP-binding cassette domain-containing protein [Umezawaea endophytica]|uniref:ATP-binding cassette domain-containing protein n=1 Tax=Umezawaea endophytica TaxID=1654476 RepID=A0A9X2VHG4_9PSEU|nr:ATP-binding cassette domain-containing protein [Umezawaea endophytica]MCS7476706.1 ATP-binding cassette domain-containing protein [Umezawaea endophytica]